MGNQWIGWRAAARTLAGCLASWLALTSEAAADEGRTAEAVAPAAGAAYLDPLGFLLFGPTLGAELSIDPASLVLYGRWFSAGILAKTMFTDGDEAFAFSYGAGLGGRYWLSGGLDGAHLGLLVEYLRTQLDDEPALITSKSSFIVPQVEGGYRVAFSSVFLGARGALGYAVRTSSSIEDLPGGNSADLYEADDVNTIYGAAAIDLGVYF